MHGTLATAPPPLRPPGPCAGTAPACTATRAEHPATAAAGGRQTRLTSGAVRTRRRRCPPAQSPSTGDQAVQQQHTGSLQEAPSEHSRRIQRGDAAPRRQHRQRNRRRHGGIPCGGLANTPHRHHAAHWRSSRCPRVPGQRRVRPRSYLQSAWPQRAMKQLQQHRQSVLQRGSEKPGAGLQQSSIPPGIRRIVRSAAHRGTAARRTEPPGPEAQPTG